MQKQYLDTRCIAEILSFLDITEYEDVIDLLVLDCTKKTKTQILNHWLHCSAVVERYLSATYYDFTELRINGKLHSVFDKPALKWTDGEVAWYKNNKCHRDNDQPAIERSNGYRAWYKNGERHRDNDKPARIKDDGTELWYQNGLLHRDNGKPAIIFPDGRMEWWVNDKRIKKTE